MNIVHCAVCKKMPHEIDEYVKAVRGTTRTPVQYVTSQEGTYNRDSGRFYCTGCYVAIGMPSGKAP